MTSQRTSILKVRDDPKLLDDDGEITKEEVGSSIPEYEISSLLDKKLARWSTASYAMALAYHSCIWNNDCGDFCAWPVEILVIASPTGYMSTTSGFPSLNWGIFYKFLKNDR